MDRSGVFFRQNSKSLKAASYLSKPETGSTDDCLAQMDSYPPPKTIQRDRFAMTYYESGVRVGGETLREPMSDERGFLILQDGIELLHQMSEFRNPQATWGGHWDGPPSQIPLPEKAEGTSVGDRTHPNFELPR
jgi:hypothetical protein